MSNFISNMNWRTLEFENFPESNTVLQSREENHESAHQEESKTGDIENDVMIQNEVSEELARLKEQGFQEGISLGKEEGFQAGYGEGRLQGYDAGREEITRELEEEILQKKMIALETITQLVANFQYAIQQLNEQIVPHLGSLALVAVEKMIGKIGNTGKQQLIQIIQELLNQYPPLGENIKLYINPDDIIDIEDHFKEEMTKYGWCVVVDPTIESGGCRVLSEKVEIDATISSRWKAVSAIIQKEIH